MLAHQVGERHRQPVRTHCPLPASRDDTNKRASCAMLRTHRSSLRAHQTPRWSSWVAPARRMRTPASSSCLCSPSQHALAHSPLALLRSVAACAACCVRCMSLRCLAHFCVLVVPPPARRRCRRPVRHARHGSVSRHQRTTRRCGAACGAHKQCFSCVQPLGPRSCHQPLGRGRAKVRGCT